jgi:hypothetical protein
MIDGCKWIDPRKISGASRVSELMKGFDASQNSDEGSLGLDSI